MPEPHFADVEATDVPQLEDGGLGWHHFLSAKLPFVESELVLEDPVLGSAFSLEPVIGRISSASLAASVFSTGRGLDRNPLTASKLGSNCQMDSTQSSTGRMPRHPRGQIDDCEPAEVY